MMSKIYCTRPKPGTLSSCGVVVFLFAASLSATEEKREGFVIAPTEVLASPVTETIPATAPKNGPQTAHTKDLEDKAADFRFVITGGLAGGRLGSEGFFDSAVFRRQVDLPLRIQNGAQVAWRTPEGLFFSLDASMSAEEIVQGQGETSKRQKILSLFGPDLVGFAPNESDLENVHFTALKRVLSAVKLDAALETRTVGTTEVFGFDPTPETPLIWPTTAEELSPTPAALGRIGTQADGFMDVLLFARQKGGLHEVLGVVDERLSQASPVQALYVDIGGALPTGSNAMEPGELLQLMLARNPAALGVGRDELSARKRQRNILSKGPYVSSVQSKSAPSDETFPACTKLVHAGERKILFVALGGLGNRAKSWLESDEQALTLAETLDRAAIVASEVKPDLILGIALSDESAASALTSSLLDGVLHLASSKLGALPAFDDIGFQNNHALKLHAGPGLIRVSYADVTEVEMWMGPSSRLSRTRIHRIPVVDVSNTSSDAQGYLSKLRAQRDRTGGFPDRRMVPGNSSVWTQSELDAVAGGMVRDFYSSEISILPRSAEPAPTGGSIPRRLVAAWLPRDASLVNLQLSGEQLTSIWQHLGATGEQQHYSVTGANLAAGRVGDRTISTRESYDVTMALTLVQRLRSLGVSFVLGEKQLNAARSFEEIFSVSLEDENLVSRIEEWLDAPAGVPLHSLYLDVTGVDLALSFTEVQGTEPLSAIRDARVQTPRNHTLGLNGDVHLVYEGPLLLSKAGVTSQFSRTVLDGPGTTPVVQEPRDQLIFDGDLRLPVARIFQSQQVWIPLPNLRVSYQTEWTPSQSTKEDGSLVDNKRRSELRGLLGAGWDLAPWLSESRLGLFLEYDFADPFTRARGWGAEGALATNWQMGLFSFSLSSLYRGYVPSVEQDNEEDIGAILQSIGSVSVPVFHGLGLSLFADTYFLWGRVPQTRGPASSLIVGAALTYSARAKWQPFRHFHPFR